MPLDDEYSFDFGRNGQTRSETKIETIETIDETIDETNPFEVSSKWNLSEDEKKIVLLLKEEPSITQKKLHEKSEIPMGTIKRMLPKLQKNGVIRREGNNRSGKWIINEAK